MFTTVNQLKKLHQKSKHYKEGLMIFGTKIMQHLHKIPTENYCIQKDDFNQPIFYSTLSNGDYRIKCAANMTT